MAGNPAHTKELEDLRAQLLAMMPKSNPAAQPAAGGSAEEWKDTQANPTAPAAPGRLQGSGTFSKTADGGLIFTDQASGQVYYPIKELADTIEPHLRKPVKVVANVKDSTKGKAKVMVHLVSIQAGP